MAFVFQQSKTTRILPHFKSSLIWRNSRTRQDLGSAKSQSLLLSIYQLELKFPVCRRSCEGAWTKFRNYETVFITPFQSARHTNIHIHELLSKGLTWAYACRLRWIPRAPSLCVCAVGAVTAVTAWVQHSWFVWSHHSCATQPSPRVFSHTQKSPFQVHLSSAVKTTWVLFSVFVFSFPIKKEFHQDLNNLDTKYTFFKY